MQNYSEILKLIFFTDNTKICSNCKKSMKIISLANIEINTQGD